MKSFLVITLLVASAIAAPAENTYSDPRPGYTAEAEVIAHYVDEPPTVIGELRPMRQPSKYLLHDDENHLYFLIRQPDSSMIRKVQKVLRKFEDVKDSDDFNVYLYLVVTPHDSEFKRGIYSDSHMNLYFKN